MLRRHARGIVRHVLRGLLVTLASVTFLHAADKKGDPQGATPSAAPPRRTASEAKATVLRTSDGRPNLRGYWNSPDLLSSNILEEHAGGFGIQAGPTVVMDPPDGKIPYQPWALAQRNENRKAENAYLDSGGRCALPGMPRIMLFDFEALYTANDLVLIFGHNETTRIIHMGRRTHLPSAIHLWMGDSIGYWEGDALVVDTANFNGKFWFALGGDFATDALRTVERFVLTDANHLQWQATLTDPKALTRPWTWKDRVFERNDGEDWLEDACHEGNAALVHLKNLYDKARAAAPGK